MTPDLRRPGSILSIALLSAICAAVLAGGFARRQSLWVDETTQLAGIAKPLPQMMRFLVGQPSTFDQADVPADRMPPLSYLVGKAWAGVIGFSERSLRCMGVSLFAMAVLCTSMAAGLSVGEASNGVRGKSRIRSALFAGLSMALSPTAVWYAPEIRAYPLLMLTASMALLAFSLICRKPTRGGVALLIIATVLAAYTHYFGLLMTGAIFAALGVRAMVHRQSLRPLVVGAVIVAVCDMGLLPFLRQAFAMSHGQSVLTTPAADGNGAFLRLFARFFSHGATLYFHGMTTCNIVCVLLVLLVGIGAGCRRVDSNRTDCPAGWMVLVVVIGTLGILAAPLVGKAFNARAVSYNLWMLPFLAGAIGAASSQARGFAMHWGTSLVSCVLVTTEIAPSMLLVTRGEWFAHGTEPAAAALVVRAGVSNVTVLHDGPGRYMPYYPLRHDFDRELTQYVVVSADGELGHARGDVQVSTLPLNAIRTSTVLVMITQSTTSQQIVSGLRSGGSSIADTPILASLRAAGWRVVSDAVHASYISSRMILLTRP